jgi:integrase
MATRTATRSKKSAKARRPVNLSYEYILALSEFREDVSIRGHYPDSTLKGLFLHVGARSIVWRYRLQRTVKGVRKMIFKTLGEWPGVDTEEARKAALIFAGAVAADKAPPGKRTAATFELTWATYLAYLEAKATSKGKPARWHANAKRLGDNLILPTWAKWTLVDMANSPEAVEDWHAKLTRKHGPVSANHAARLIRATYKRRAARDVTLSLDRLPTSSVQWNKEEASQHALAPNAFVGWRALWDQIENPVHRGYHLFCLLTGVRPGEGARIRLQDIDPNARIFTIPNAKAGKDITLPMTREIGYAIALAVNAPPQKIKMTRMTGMKRGERKLVDRKQLHPEVIDKNLAFPGCRQISGRSGLPIAGNGLRHTFKTLHVELGIPEMLSHFLMGHALEGVSAKYIAELIIANGPALREAQETISTRIFHLLGLSVDDAYSAPRAPAMPADKEKGLRIGRTTVKTGTHRKV